ncbi:type II toxin-antitoxin system Phd/YefM family antitoxin [Glycomyces buryatensis]|nr:type II toxin-antitoxin system prevent-host-death family antitoxin [Glycomyces buryatensis]
MDTQRQSGDNAHVSVRDLQRHTSDVLERVTASGQIYITRHGRTIARILPPDPAEEQLNAAIEAGILDPRALSETYTNAQMREELPPSGRPTAGGSLSEKVIELREAEGDR